MSMLVLLLNKRFLQANLGPGATGLSMTSPEQARRSKEIVLLREIEQRLPLPQQGRPPHISPSCWNLLSCMLVPSVDRRASISVCLTHPCLNSAYGCLLAPLQNGDGLPRGAVRSRSPAFRAGKAPQSVALASKRRRVALTVQATQRVASASPGRTLALQQVALASKPTAPTTQWVASASPVSMPQQVASDSPELTMQHVASPQGRIVLSTIRCY